VRPKEHDDSVEFQQQVAAVTALLVPWLHTLFTGPGDNIVRCAHRTHTHTHRHALFLPQLNSFFQLPLHQVEFVEELMRILSYLTFHVVPTPEDLFRCGA
jgi:hypothetical protein